MIDLFLNKLEGANDKKTVENLINKGILREQDMRDWCISYDYQQMVNLGHNKGIEIAQFLGTVYNITPRQVQNVYYKKFSI